MTLSPFYERNSKIKKPNLGVGGGWGWGWEVSGKGHVIEGVNWL